MSWFGHVERVNGERLSKRLYESNVGGSRGRGRPPKRWMNSVQDAVEKRRMTVEKAKVVCQNRSEWRTIV